MNTPRNIVINPDDPKWTAYVLGELHETERAQVELLLETSEEARALVEELTLATECGSLLLTIQLEEALGLPQMSSASLSAWRCCSPTSKR